MCKKIRKEEEDIERLRINNKELTERYHDNRRRLDNDIVDLTELKEELQQKLTTIEEENQQLLTQLNTKKNGKRNTKN